MSTRKTTLFYAMLIAVASVAVGMVIAILSGVTSPRVSLTLFTGPACR